MISTLPIDCLNKIFECLEEDKALHSCLLVNRLWCRISVEILWRKIWNFKHFKLKIRTLIACLPNESKDFLLNNGVTSIPISKPPLFNYASFCKVLSIQYLFIKDGEIEILTRNPKNYLIIKEILKMFMRQISSLVKMNFNFMEYDFYKKYNFLNFINFPGAKDCLKNLSELKCNSYINSEFFLQLSKICHNINSLDIIFEKTASVGIKDLIFSQNNLKSISFISFSCNEGNFDDDIFNYFKTLTKHSNTLTKLFLYEISLPSIFTEIIFSNLRILILNFYPVNVDIFTKFLVNNGKNLEELVLCNCGYPINLAIAKYCPNLKSLHTGFKRIEELIMIFDNCQQLESIRTSYNNSNLGGKKLLEIVAKYSPKNFHELNLHYAKLNSKDLESFFISWKDRVSQRPFSFIFGGDGPVDNNKTRKLIRKYKALDVIKKFERRIDVEVEDVYISE